MITSLDQALEQNKILVEETFRMTTLYKYALKSYFWHFDKFPK